MVKEKELICQEALKTVLENEIPSDHFEIGKYKEDAVCMQWDGKQWEVYYGFRNMHDQKNVYRTVIEACIDMINRLVTPDASCEKITDNFLNLIVVDKIA